MLDNNDKCWVNNDKCWDNNDKCWDNNDKCNLIARDTSITSTFVRLTDHCYIN